MRKKINQKEIYKAIVDLALELARKKEIYSRYDLAVYLKNYGIKSDSFYIEILIYGAFKIAGNKKERTSIKKVFYDNKLTKQIIDENSIHNILQDVDFKAAVKNLDIKAKRVSKSLSDFDKEIEQLTEAALNFVAEKKIMSFLSGSFQIDKVKQEANSLYTTYEQIISKYREAKDSTNDLIEDYTFIRHEALKIYRDNVLKLTDIFGESIKAVEPNLFDYSSIEWLDTDLMLENIQLEFDRIIITCSEIVGIIHQNLVKGLSDTSKAFRGETKKIGYVLAGLQVVNSWTESANKATVIRKDLEKLKNKMNIDVSTIKGDLLRLSAIDKILKDNFIPVTDTFAQYSQEVFSSEIINLMNSFYSNKKIKEIKIKKDEILVDYSLIELEIIDHQKQIIRYTDSIKIQKIQLNDANKAYIEAQTLKPDKPSWFLNLLSLGNLMRTYNRDVSDWHRDYYPVIETYNELKIDIISNKEELKEHKKSLGAKQNSLKSLERKIDHQNQLMSNFIESNTEIRLQIAKHLVPLINLLRITRNVIEMKLDEKLVSRVEIQKINVESMPNEVKKNINEFINAMRNETIEGLDNLNISEKLKIKDFKKDLDSKPIVETNLNSDEENLPVAENDEKLLKESTKRIINTAYELVENLIKLKEQKIKNDIELSEYEERLKSLKTNFNSITSNQNERYESLQAISKNMKSVSSLEVKKAILDLDDDKESEWIKEYELINMLKNKKDINI